MESIIFYSVAAILLTITVIKDKSKAKQALKKSLMAFLKLLPQMTFILLLIGFSLAILSPETISGILGEDSGIAGVALAIGTGSVAFLPSFIAFPLGATLLEQGAGLTQVAGFVSTLMGVGFVTLSMERKFFGTRFAIYRNIGALVMTILFAASVALFLGGTL